MLTSAPSPLPLPHLFDRVRGHVLPAEWPAFAPDVDAILRDVGAWTRQPTDNTKICEIGGIA